MRRVLTPALLTGALAVLLLPALAAGAFRTNASSARGANGAAAQSAGAAPATTPIVVPRLPPAKPTTPATRAPVAQQTPAPTTKPTPAPSPASKPAPPADAAIDEDDEVVRVTSNLVVVPTSVTDAKGEPVQGLKAADFRLEEEGRSQEIAQVGDADQVPLDIALLLDVSSSVTERFQFQQQAAASFLKQVLKPADRAAVFAITDQPRLEQGLASAESAAAKLLTIPAAKGPTPTAFYDAVTRAAKYLAENAPGRHRRVILVISDGEDNFSDRIRDSAVAEVSAGGTSQTAREKQEGLHRRALAEVQREVERADAVFYSINPSGEALRLNVISTRAQAGMQQLADTTGGSSFVPERLEDLDAVFRRIAAELRAQYLLQYLSNSNAPAGKYLRIKVALPAHTDLRVRARQGYYVPKPK